MDILRIIGMQLPTPSDFSNALFLLLMPIERDVSNIPFYGTGGIVLHVSSLSALYGMDHNSEDFLLKVSLHLTLFVPQQSFLNGSAVWCSLSIVARDYLWRAALVDSLGCAG